MNASIVTQAILVLNETQSPVNLFVFPKLATCRPCEGKEQTLPDFLLLI